MSASGGGSLRLRLARSGMAGLRRRRGRAGWRRTRSVRVCWSLTSPSRWKLAGFGVRGLVARRARTAIRSCWTRCGRSSEMMSGEIPSGCFCGPPRVCVISHGSSAPKATRSAKTSSLACSRASSGSACRRIVRRGRVQHPDRDAQFRHINETVAAAIAAGQPAISVDTKKKELVGDFKNVGREWRPKARDRGSTPTTSRHELRQGDPVRGLRPRRQRGWCRVGIDHDTAQFAVASIRAWWQQLGTQRYPEAHQPDDHRRLRRLQRQPHHLWKTELQSSPTRPACDPRLPLPARHQQVEQNRAPAVQLHQPNWRGQPLSRYEVIINLIAATTTRTGLKVYARLDTHYPKGSRSPTPNSPPSTSPATRSTPSGTTPSTLKQIIDDSLLTASVLSR